MRAVVVSRHGGPERLVVEDVPAPSPKPDEILVQVDTAGVNFIDVYHRTGHYETPLPFTPGREGAGVVREVGADVSEHRVGDRVAWASGVMGSYASFAVLPSWRAVPVPDALPLRTAGAAILQGMTAHYLSNSVFAAGPDHVALVHAAAGGTGALLVQLLVAKGATVLATASTPEKLRVAMDLGARAAAVYDDAGEMVREHTEGRGVHVSYDGVGQATFDASLRLTRERGTVVLYGAASGPVPPLDPLTLMRHGALYLTRPTLVPSYVRDRQELTWRSSEVLGSIARGSLKVTVWGAFALEDAAEAHRSLEARRATGKIVLTPAEETA
jgi:NADPH2:quinone reductase